MPRNHFSSDIPEAVWWTQPLLMEPTPKTPSSKHQGLISPPDTCWGNSQFDDHQHHQATPSMSCGQTTAFSFNLNQEGDEVLDEQLTDERENTTTKAKFQEQLEMDKEPMFQKLLTPSDVGKLNRLVIPKQHAEKYFPLGGCGGDTGEKGLLLGFEDEAGKSWSFRYSYWNSSQSYVLTKGWSRFVKEKRLDAGDVVLFERHRVDGDRLFIGWRRRSTSTTASSGHDNMWAQPAAVATNSGRGVSQVFYSAHSYPPDPHRVPTPYQPNCLHAVVQNQTTPSGNSKRLRLFGVNLEYCQPDESEPSTPDGSSVSSQGCQGHYQYCTSAHASNPQSDKDINSSRDANQMRYHHQG